ncbi:uncharacterized protein LOC128997373 [Macrosteles quadrilineatus]|uniref:uncharacterized protein LOC128997373 n=1 Tax=Macrosteles quadrilineatus TaxID=74068 RepID=UPI0023E2E4F6|nr:uncharacterized protein LOC128997373 [Macrosteles quadrilineatus]
MLHDTILERKVTIKDLGVILTSNLSPDLHIDSVCTRSSKLLGFIIRASRDGINIEALRILYTSLVRPVLEYASVVWSPYQTGHKDRLEKIQRRFIKIIGVKLGFNYSTVPIDDVANYLKLTPLEERRKMIDALFLKRLLTNMIDCPELLDLITFRIPTATRTQELFHRHQCSTSYGFHSPVPRLHRQGNTLTQHHDYDFFNDSDSALKRIFSN